MLTVLGMLCSFGACDGPARRAGAGASLIELSPAEVNTLATPAMVADVVDLEVLQDGSVWILNSLEPFFVALDSNGDLIRAFGEGGDGPDEFGSPRGLVEGGIQGEAWAFDSWRHGLVRISGPGPDHQWVALPQSSIPAGSVQGGNPFRHLVRTARVGTAIVLPRKSDVPTGGIYTQWLSTWNADLVSFRPESEAAELLVSLSDALGDPTPHFMRPSSFPPFPLWWRLWAPCGPDQIRVYDRLTNSIRGFTLNGTELPATALLPLESMGVSPEEFAYATFELAVFEISGEIGGEAPRMPAGDSVRILERTTDRLEGTPEDLANLLPRYAALRCDPIGTQWIQLVDLEEGGLGGSQTWVRIPPDGPLGTVRFPPGFEPYRFTENRIWGVLRDELDVASVAWIANPRD